MTAGPGLTIELDGKTKTRPDALIAHIRKTAPHLLDEGQQDVPPQPAGPAVPSRRPEAEPLLTPAEVAVMFRVDPKTVTRWAKAGKLTSIRTLGGHRRYREAEVRALLAGIPAEAQVS